MLESECLGVEFLGQMVINEWIQQIFQRVFSSKDQENGRTGSAEVVTLLIVALCECFVPVRVVVIDELVIVEILFHMGAATAVFVVALG